MAQRSYVHKPGNKITLLDWTPGTLGQPTTLTGGRAPQPESNTEGPSKEKPEKNQEEQRTDRQSKDPKQGPSRQRTQNTRQEGTQRAKNKEEHKEKHILMSSRDRFRSI